MGLTSQKGGVASGSVFRRNVFVSTRSTGPSTSVCFDAIHSRVPCIAFFVGTMLSLGVTGITFMSLSVIRVIV